MTLTKGNAKMLRNIIELKQSTKRHINPYIGVKDHDLV